MSKIKFIDSDKDYNEVSSKIFNLYDTSLLFCRVRDKEKYIEQNFKINKEVESYIIKNELYIKAGHQGKMIQLVTLKEKIASKQSSVLKQSEKEVFYQIDMSDYLSIDLMLKMNKEMGIKTNSDVRNTKI